GNALVGPAVGLHDAADRLHGSRRTDGRAPATLAVVRAELLQFHGDFGLRLVPAPRGDLAVFEEAQGTGDATDLQALAFQRFVTATDDELGTAAADIDDQTLFLAERQPARHALVDQARFLAPRYHFDRMSQRGFRRQQESLRIAQLAHGIGGDGAHPAFFETRQALAEAGQGSERELAMLGRQRTVLAQSRGEADAFAQAVDHPDLAMRVARNDQMETVGADVGCGDQVAVADFCWKVGGLHGQSLPSNASCAECGLAPSGWMRV